MAPIVASGVGPLMVEYIDLITMTAIAENRGLDLGVPKEVKEAALAYLVLVLEQRRDDRLDEDVEGSSPPSSASLAPSTCTSCRPRPAPS